MSPMPFALIIHENRTDVDPNHKAESLYCVKVQIKQIPAQKRLTMSNKFVADIKYLYPSLKASDDSAIVTNIMPNTVNA